MSEIYIIQFFNINLNTNIPYHIITSKTIPNIKDLDDLMENSDKVNITKPIFTL